MRELHAFVDGDHVGTFVEETDDTIRFIYDEHIGMPLSLSLPRGREHAPGAAFAYLDGLLPDRSVVRERWARERDLGAVDVMTLLASYGEDVAGAVTLATDSSFPRRSVQPAIRASEEDIAARVAALHHEDTSWDDPRARPRMSLAGAQGKFSLAQSSGEWFWPTHELPSTHILKPPSTEHRRIDEFESATLEFARGMGIASSRSETAEYLGQRTFVVERWDRADGARVHAEDLNQALGRPTSQKYDVRADEVLRILRGTGQEEAFLRQLAFNAAVGNADAHAKNYSLLHAGAQVRLAPLYDALPTYFWPKYDTRLAMSIGDARNADALTDANWRKLAHSADLDEGFVLDTVRPVQRSVADGYLDAFAAFRDDTARMRLITKQVSRPRHAAGRSSRE